MKKNFSTLLALVRALAFVGCSNTVATTTTTAETTTTATAAQESNEKLTIRSGALSYGSATEEQIEAIVINEYKAMGIENHAEVKVAFYDDMNSALLGLQRKDIDNLGVFKATADYLTAQNPDLYDSRTIPSSAVRVLSMAVKEENTQLLEKLNTAIVALKADGTLEAMEKEYLADPSALPEAKDIPVIDSAETIGVVVTGDMPPFDYVTSDGKAAGYNVALLSAVAEKAQLNIELVYANAGSRYIQLTSGKADAIFWTTGVIYPESDKANYANDLPEGMAVTDYYLTQEFNALILKTDDAETTTAADQKTKEQEYYYGTLAGGGGMTSDEMREFYDEAIGNVDFNDGTTGYQWRAVLYDDLNSALLGLERRDVGALCLLEPTVRYIAACNAQTMEAHDYGDTTQMALSMATLDTNTELLEKLNVALDALEKDGTLEKLEKEYTADPTALPETKEISTIDGAETIKVIVTGDMPPFDYVTSDGKAAGYNIALLSAISEKSHLNIELVYANAGSRYVQLTSGKADAIFWARGQRYTDSGEFDFSADLPKGMAVTQAYTAQRLWAVVMK